MKKIMLLGGSKQQVPAINHAKNLGYYTILCDFLEDNPGQDYANEFHCVSTTDKQAILKIALEIEIDGIIAYASDPAASTAAFVAEKMNLATSPYESIRLLTNKDEFRNFLEKNDFYTPKSKGFSNLSEAKKEINTFRLPVIIKPVDSSGSKGVDKINHVLEIDEKYENAMNFSRSKRVILEEYVEMAGYQVAGDGFSVDGKLVFRCFANDHFNNEGLNPYIPISASFPYNMPQRTHEKIHNEIQRLFDLLKMKTGAYNFDVRIDGEENVYIMEIGPRNGGNYIPQVTKYATGVDMLDYTIKAAMGEDCSDLQMVQPNRFWSYYAIHSLKSGVLKDIDIRSDVREKIVESHLNYQISDIVPAFEGSNGNIGILIMEFETMDEMLNMMDYSDEWIKVIVE